MPIYQYRCRKCKRVFDQQYIGFDKVGCEMCSCGGVGDKVISSTSFKIEGEYTAETGYSKKELLKPSSKVSVPFKDVSDDS